MTRTKTLRAGLACVLLATTAAIAAPAAPAPLPKDSVYQLPARLTDQQGRQFDWSTRRGTPQEHAEQLRCHRAVS